MAEVNELLDLLLGDEASGEGEAAPEEPDTEPTGESEGLNMAELFSFLDTYQQVVSEIKNDERAQLIKAIRPFLSEERKVKADNCLKFLSVTRFMEHREELSKIGGKMLPV